MDGLVVGGRGVAGAFRCGGGDLGDAWAVLVEEFAEVELEEIAGAWVGEGEGDGVEGDVDSGRGGGGGGGWGRGAAGGECGEERDCGGGEGGGEEAGHGAG